MSFADAMTALSKACGADIEAHCRGVPLGGDRIRSCLAKNADKVSSNCINTYAATMNSLAQRIAAQIEAPQLCAADIKRLCSNFREGEGRILRCLIRSDNVRKVTNRCNDAINEAGWR